MTQWGRCSIAALALSACLDRAAACDLPLLRLERVTDGALLMQVHTDSFALRYRHSVTQTPVDALYSIAPDGRITQTEERFSTHGPGLAHDGAGWRQDGAEMVLPLDRPIPRLVLRTAPEHENRLIVGGTETDLTLWPGEPLELGALPCKDTAP
ncbi:MAG: DUF1850 domain-containing protein [Pseudorhodobacter sp.]